MVCVVCDIREFLSPLQEIVSKVRCKVKKGGREMRRKLGTNPRALVKTTYDHE